MGTVIELPRPVNRNTVEEAYRRAMEMQRRHEWNRAETAMRAVRARDPKVLLVLDKAANVMDEMVEEQYGRTLRDAATPYGERVVPTEASLWQEAYRLADEGRPTEHFRWIYAAACELAGLFV